MTSQNRPAPRGRRSLLTLAAAGGPRFGVAVRGVGYKLGLEPALET